MPDQVADSARATRFVEVGALGGVDLLLELVDVFLLLPFERVPEPRDDFFAVVFRDRAGEDARVAMSLTLSTMATSSRQARRRVR
ncbi:amidase [Cutibacterium avidum]|uniref:amidase n=1 Tax=Cutibacterium avidum TaxID=33010 RepID=UPI002FF08157